MEYRGGCLELDTLTSIVIIDNPPPPPVFEYTPKIKYDKRGLLMKLIGRRIKNKE